jgi:type VI secretion system protein VasD
MLFLMLRHLVRIGLLAVTFSLVGCASSAGGGGVLDSSLQMLGITKPNVPDVSAVPLPPVNKKVALRIHAGERLNVDGSGRSLSIVVRIYKLKDPNAFTLAPYDAFKNSDTERVAFGGDIIDVREIVLTPGQKHEVVETLSPSAPFLAVAALFRAPAQGRWHFAFDAAQAEKKGLTLGVHDCALSVATGEPVNAPPEALRLAGVRCQ